MTPADVHSSHDVREEGEYISDPVCQLCRYAVPHAALRDPCGGKFVYTHPADDLTASG